jgi:hypothetical protein
MTKLATKISNMAHQKCCWPAIDEKRAGISGQHGTAPVTGGVQKETKPEMNWPCGLRTTGGSRRRAMCPTTNSFK